ncbi:MAG TPA: methyltransferase domain-containing protein [Burkholderiales bacterium]
MPGIDRRAARRRFDRAAPTYRDAARLEAEVATRMLERLDYLRLAPRRILDAASGPPARALGKRYPGAQVIALDFALQMLQPRGFQWFRRSPLLVCAELERLPLAAEAIDFTWCNMALHWVTDPLPALREFARVLVPEGLLMFSTLGPDTLKELRAAAGAARVHSFTDMHDLGDMLVAAGFTAPVMDMEMLDIAYRDPAALLADLRASGQTSARADRPRGLTGRRYGAALRAKLGPKATFEVVYGHAWKAGRKHPDVEPAPKTVRVFKRMP